ncbi:VanZ family protein [Streptomyces sp. NPDC001220]
MWQLVLYITPATVALGTATCLLACVIGAGLRRTNGEGFTRGVRILLYLAVGVVLLATITPDQSIGSGDGMVWVVPGESLFSNPAMGDLERSMYLRQQVANAAMFVPLSILFRFSFPVVSAPLTVLAGCALSVAIEFVQWLMRAGRVADIDDVIVNTGGAAIGVLLYLLGYHLAAIGPRRRERPRRVHGVRR